MTFPKSSNKKKDSQPLSPEPFTPLVELQSLYPSMQVFSTYITVRDGTRLAADIYLPDPLPQGTRLPTLLEQTRYWRSTLIKPPLGWFMPSEGDAFPRSRKIKRMFTSQGYAYVVVDVRGTGASFGVWRYPWEPVTVLDAEDILIWISSQPWSDGQIAGIGVSYPGTCAELLLATGFPGLKAVIPQFNHPDAFTDAGFPGGILNERFVRAWGEMDIDLDLNRPPAIYGKSMNKVMQGVRPVGGRHGRQYLNEAVKMHRDNGKLHGLPGGLIFRDETHPLAGYSANDAASIVYQDALQSSQVPVFAWASWMDAGTAQAAIRRYLTYTGPQRVVIGAWNHGGVLTSDPYLDEGAPLSPPSVVKRAEILRFLNRYMKSEQNEPPENSLIYYTCGTESWHKTSQWPPEGIQSQKLYFAPERRLVHHQPDGEGEDVFAVDFRASSGRYNRWWELGVAERRSVTYGDRSLQNDHVLAYQSDPLEHDWEITGSPVLSLYVDSSEPDCSFFAYLEDVFPDGKIVCIGEGLLRAIHRKILPSPSVFYEDLPYHSFRQADAMPLKPGEIGEVTFALLPMSVLIRRGHRLRITIAGHDQGNFERVPAVGQPIWKIQRSRQYPSRIQLPGKFR